MLFSFPILPDFSFQYTSRLIFDLRFIVHPPHKNVKFVTYFEEIVTIGVSSFMRCFITGKNTCGIDGKPLL